MKNSQVRDIIDGSLGIKKERSRSAIVALNESYIATPKTYEMATELVSPSTKEAHFELYSRYIKALNDTSAKLDSVDRKTVTGPANTFRSLKIDEAWALNAVWLHELYFANASDVKSEVFTDSLSFMRLERDFGGGFTGWQFDMLACGSSVRSGWVVCGYHMFHRRYINFFVDGHDAHVPVGLYPVSVIDCWEHARVDYENDVEMYMRGQLQELNWAIINERFKRAEKIAEALGG